MRWFFTVLVLDVFSVFRSLVKVLQVDILSKVKILVMMDKCNTKIQNAMQQKKTLLLNVTGKRTRRESQLLATFQLQQYPLFLKAFAEQQLRKHFFPYGTAAV